MKIDKLDIVAAIMILLILVLAAGLMLGMEISSNACKASCEYHDGQ